MNAIRIADSADCELNASAEDEIVRLFDGLNETPLSNYVAF